MSAKTSRLTIDLSPAQHKRLKMAATVMGTSMKDIVILGVDAFLHQKPNKVTLKAMRQSETGKGLKKFANIDEFLKDLGI